MVASAVAVLHAKSILGARVIEEAGHTVAIVEQCLTYADLDSHAAGAPMQRLNELNADLLLNLFEGWLLDAVPQGDSSKFEDLIVSSGR